MNLIWGAIIQDYSTLDVKNVIIHEILRQKRGDDKEPPIYSEIESNLNDDSKKFLRSKLINSIGSKNAHGISFDEDSDSSVPEIIKKMGLL